MSSRRVRQMFDARVGTARRGACSVRGGGGAMPGVAGVCSLRANGGVGPDAQGMAELCITALFHATRRAGETRAAYPAVGLSVTVVMLLRANRRRALPFSGSACHAAAFVVGVRCSAAARAVRRAPNGAGSSSTRVPRRQILPSTMPYYRRACTLAVQVVR